MNISRSRNGVALSGVFVVYCNTVELKKSAFTESRNAS